MAWFKIAVGNPAGNFQASGGLYSHLGKNSSSGKPFDQVDEE